MFITVQTIAKLNLGHRNKFEIEFQKISHRSSRFSDSAEFGHFTLLFRRGRQRNVQRVNVKSYNARAEPLFCSLQSPICHVLLDAQNTHRRALIHQQQTNKTKQHLRI